MNLYQSCGTSLLQNIGSVRVNFITDLHFEVIGFILTGTVMCFPLVIFRLWFDSSPACVLLIRLHMCTIEGSCAQMDRMGYPFPLSCLSAGLSILEKRNIFWNGSNKREERDSVQLETPLKKRTPHWLDHQILTLVLKQNLRICGKFQANNYYKNSASRISVSKYKTPT